MIKIRNFTQVEQFIKQNPSRAMEESARWTAFARNNPIVNQFQTAEQFYKWSDKNPQLAVDASIWQAREVQAAFSEIRQNNIRSQYGQDVSRRGGGAGPAGLLLAGPLALFMRNQPELMQDDSRYKKIQEQLKQQWLKDNPGKMLDSQEGVDYVYGSLDDENAASLEEEAEKLFREKHQKDGEKFDKKRSRVYKNPDQDLALLQMRTSMQEHARARYDLLSRTGATVNWAETSQKIGQHEWDKFIANYPEKAAKYAAKNPALTAALARAEERRVMEEQQIEQWGETGAPTVEEYQPLVEPSPDEEDHIPEGVYGDVPSQDKSTDKENAPHKPSDVRPSTPKKPPTKAPPKLPSAAGPRAANLARFARMVGNVAKLARLAALFANPVGAGVLIAIVLIIVFTLIILHFPQTGSDRFPGEMEEGPIPTLPPGTTADCPAPGASITFGSYGTGPKAHCTEAFEGCQFGPNGELPRRAKSIDIDTQGKIVIFPTISGQKVNWFYLAEFALNKPGECERGVSNCGYGYVFEAKTSDNTRWALHLLHIDSFTAQFKRFEGSNSSGTVVGKTVVNVINDQSIPVVLHVNIGKNIKNAGSPPAGGSDFEPGWIKPEDLGMCTK